MKTEWNQPVLDRIAASVAVKAAARVHREAQKIAGDRFKVSLDGSTVTGDAASRVIEYGDGLTPADPWAHKAIRNAGYEGA